VLGVACLAGVARAAEPAPSGFSLQADPAPASDRFFRVHDGRVRGLLTGYVSLARGVALHPLRGAEPEFVTTQLTGNVGAALAVAELLLVGADLPTAILQRGDAGFDREPEAAALGDARLTLRIAWLETRSRSFALGSEIGVWLPTGDEAELGGDGAVRARPMLSASGQSAGIAYALNAGYQFRREHALSAGEIGPGIGLGAALALLLLDDALQIGPELAGTTPAADPFASGASPVEALFGVRLRARSVLFGLAAGGGLTRAPGDAELRVVGSITLSPDERVLDRDSDELVDRRDACPDDPGFLPDGCPPPDRDADTVPDREDACPAEPGLVHADPRRHGCPPASTAAPSRAEPAP
jgi:hypothetical protein